MVVTFLEFPLWSLVMAVLDIPKKINQRKIDCFIFLLSFIGSPQREKKKKKMLIEMNKTYSKKDRI